MNEKRISPSRVNLSNVDEFENQIREDLPLGTPKQDVEAYLSCTRIPHVFGDHSRIGNSYHFGKAFTGTIQDIGVRVIFATDLMFWIGLDAADKVSEIRFRLAYDAP